MRLAPTSSRTNSGCTGAAGAVLHAAADRLRPTRPVYGDDEIDNVDGSAYLLAGTGCGVTATALQAGPSSRQSGEIACRGRGRRFLVGRTSPRSSRRRWSSTRSRGSRSCCSAALSIPFLTAGCRSCHAAGRRTGLRRDGPRFNRCHPLGRRLICRRQRHHLPMAFVSGSFSQPRPSRPCEAIANVCR